MHAFEATQLAQRLLDLRAVLLHLLEARIGFAELGLDRAQLLAQVVLALAARHLVLRLGLDLGLDRGDVDLATQEREEIEIIKEFLPEQLGEAEMRAVCAEAIKATGSAGLRDMGKCMAALKARYSGRMDFGKASQVVKEKLQ